MYEGFWSDIRDLGILAIIILIASRDRYPYFGWITDWLSHIPYLIPGLIIFAIVFVGAIVRGFLERLFGHN